MAAENKKIKYGFVVLHYMTYEMTTQCVFKLLNNFGQDDIKIAIVDNGSGNGSGEKLLEQFKNNSKVEVILRTSNDGFARGNNVGYSYLKDKYDPDYMIVLNNDVLIDQRDFLDKINKIHAETFFAVLGPDIVSLTSGRHQNPDRLQNFTKDELKVFYDITSGRCRHPFYHYYRNIFAVKCENIFCREKKPVLETEHENKHEKMAVNPVLHGSCLIFSREFMDKRAYCFCPESFMYMEEFILHYECMQNGLKIIYSPEISLIHIEDVSTNYSIKSKFQRYRMKNAEMKKSIEVLLKKMN